MRKQYIPGMATTALLSMSITLMSCSSQTAPEQIESGSDQSGDPVVITAPEREHHVTRSDAENDQPDIYNQTVAEPSPVKPAELAQTVAAYPSAKQATLDRVTGLKSHFYRHPGIVQPPQNRERYAVFEDAGVKWAHKNPVSTFAVDVDSAAYANMRRQINAGQQPNPESIRVEELVNYFAYDYPAASHKNTPFSIYTEIGPSPWAKDRKLLHVGIKGWEVDNEDLPPANIVFLIDVSGSMQSPNKIGLLKSAMKMMVSQMRPQDHIAIAVYAGAAGEVLAPTPGDQKATIRAALDNLRAGGSTNGGAGIRLAYNLAQQQFTKGGVNRIILAKDGDFNVGTTDTEALKQLVEQKRNTGIALSVLGFGTGNYNDQLMQTIAQNGNGNAAYIDTINEARKVLVEELGATLNIIAKDMKVQIEFNPAVVDTYRLIGYETRHLDREDFNNDKVDAGDVGAGHTVTALYEITLRGETTLADPLRYQDSASEQYNTGSHGSDELAFLKLRYKSPDADTSKLISHPLMVREIQEEIDDTSTNYRFADAVAWFGQLLRNNKQVDNTDMQSMIELASQARGVDTHGYRVEFINLAKTTSALILAESNVRHETELKPDGSEISHFSPIKKDTPVKKGSLIKKGKHG